MGEVASSGKPAQDLEVGKYIPFPIQATLQLSTRSRQILWFIWSKLQVASQPGKSWAIGAIEEVGRHTANEVRRSVIEPPKNLPQLRPSSGNREPLGLGGVASGVGAGRAQIQGRSYSRSDL
jgi:hypothetical protein